MPLETATTIDGLVGSNPTGTDSTTEGNDHLQLIKNVLKITFPGTTGDGLNAPITATENEFNSLVGVTSSIQEQIDFIQISGSDLVTNEADLRANADTALGIQITDEAVTRLESDESLYTTLNNEMINKTNTIQADVDLNQIKSQSDDTEIVEFINIEKSDRIAADEVLEDLIDSSQFSVGTKMLFVQASAPLGWTWDKSESDRMLRIVNSNDGGDIGGTDSPISFTVNHTHIHENFSHVLTLDEMPIHDHSITAAPIGSPINAPTATAFGYSIFNFGAISIPDGPNIDDIPPTSSSGGDMAHSHNSSTDIFNQNFRLKYTNVIIAAKD